MNLNLFTFDRLLFGYFHNCFIYQSLKNTPPTPSTPVVKNMKTSKHKANLSALKIVKNLSSDCSTPGTVTYQNGKLISKCKSAPIEIEHTEVGKRLDVRNWSKHLRLVVFGYFDNKTLITRASLLSRSIRNQLEDSTLAGTGKSNGQRCLKVDLNKLIQMGSVIPKHLNYAFLLVNSIEFTLWNSKACVDYDTETVGRLA